MLRRRKLISVIIFILIVVIALLLFTYFRPKQEIASCSSPTKLEDYSNRQDHLLICKDLISYGKRVVATREQYPALFEYKVFQDEKPSTPQFEAVIYFLDEKEFIAIFPIINPVVSYTRAGYVFEKENNGYKLIFERPFSSLSGRWTGVRFSGGGSIFEGNSIEVYQDLGVLAGLGNVIPWSDYYDWDSAQNTYVLANNKHIFDIKDMQKRYEDMNGSNCEKQSSTKLSNKILDLYPTRKNIDHYCPDNSQVPFVTKEQATSFMKGLKALEMIKNGANISKEDVEKIKL